MTRLRRLALTAGLAWVGLLSSAQPALAHGGGNATSNYRTRVLSVEPQVEDLTVRLFDVQGTIELSYTGPGTLVVIGYEGEPYLRIGPSGVERNIHSPATYLNQNRYARVALPAAADASLEPQWERIGSGRTVSFHDHRTHWMSTVPPPQVQADPDRVTVIFDRWEIPLSIDGHPAVIAGDLAWVPPPSRLPWIAIGVLLAAATATALVLGRWQRVAIAIAAIGSVVFGVDTLGYWRAAQTTAVQRVWLIGWPAVAVAATVTLFVLRRRSAQTPSAFIALAALIIAAIGGWDRIDVISKSQLQSTHPDWLTRVSAVSCLALGTTLIIRFLADLVPRAIGTVPPNTGESGTQLT
jgi:hypothetical protein